MILRTSFSLYQIIILVTKDRVHQLKYHSIGWILPSNNTPAYLESSSIHYMHCFSPPHIPNSLSMVLQCASFAEPPINIFNLSLKGRRSSSYFKMAISSRGGPLSTSNGNWWGRDVKQRIPLIDRSLSFSSFRILSKMSCISGNISSWSVFMIVN